MQRKCLIRAGAVVLATLALLVLSNSASLFAQRINTGKIEGTVRDKDTGMPLAGAQVLVEGTRLGNVTNADGYYFILNVPPGRRSVTFTYTGYQKTTVADVMILAGQTMTVDGSLSSTVVQIDGITVEGESDVLLPRDETTTKRRLTTERLEELPATTLEDLMILEAGVQIGGEDARSRGLKIRGGRLGEEAMIVDGVMVRNYTALPLAGGGGWRDEFEEGTFSEDATPLEFSFAAVEQVDVGLGHTRRGIPCATGLHGRIRLAACTVFQRAVSAEGIAGGFGEGAGIRRYAERIAVGRLLVERDDHGVVAHVKPDGR